MEQQKIEYAVIILNYNTIDDAIGAARTVEINAQSDKYVICIADNNSINEYDHEKLKEVSGKHLVTVQINSNGGYAKGNNVAISFVLKKYAPRYIVIMNPDVQLIEKGTIESLIKEIDLSENNVVGAQPLVWNYHYNSDAQKQINIRKVPTYFDECILSSVILKLVFRKRYKKFCYLDKIPYKDKIKYESPSGAFFVISTEIFKNVGLFDEGTFLYDEEIILGYKLAQIGKKFILIPDIKVKHEHGKAIGNNRFTINKKGMQHMLDSRIYYVKKYLGAGKVRISILRLLSYMDYYIKCIICFMQKLIWRNFIKR